ncbi:MAG: ATP-binding protein [Gracilibacteraceae bacterium]|jgi:AAA+ ATPase superfamily predicted ATPase|nr:ATP-binding protein [Gracilibacteraceae bacterium]
MFIGRERELKTLSQHYNSGSFEFFCIYGRRRVGKTELIKEFIKGKKSVFFTGLEDTKEVNLTNFSHAVRETLHGAKGKAIYADFNEAFADIFEYARAEKLVLVIDEYPYLAKSYPGISSLLQVEIDHRLNTTDMFIILCGSSMSFMEKQVMGHESPLYGRRTGQIKTLPFDYETSKKFCPQGTGEETALIYGLTGGIAKYLQLFGNDKSLEDNIKTNFLNSDEVLFEEPLNLLNQELREPALYNSVITAVAAGSTKVNEIGTKTHLNSAACVKYLKNLVELGIMKREIPIFDKPTSKKCIYRLNDGMFRFWYRFVYKNISKIQLGLGAEVYDDIKDQIPDFMGEVFEQICQEYMWKAKLPFSVSAIGRWWGNNPVKKAEQEIDFIAADSGGARAIFCECKWRNEKTPESVIDKLIDKAAVFNCKEKYYYLFSKSAFTDPARKRAAKNIKLIEFGDMFSPAPPAG